MDCFLAEPVITVRARLRSSLGAHSCDPLAPLRKRFTFVAGNDGGEAASLDLGSTPRTRRDRPAANHLQQIRPHRLDMLLQKPAGLVDLLRPA
jgi:hypothetical protein